MRRSRVITWLLVTCLVATVTWAYRTGAPTRACGDMTPQHGSPINTDPAPFLVEVSKTQYSPNERIYVRIRGCGDARFKGFMIQPRSALYPDRPAFLGAFLRVRGTRYECVRTGAVLTHSSPDEKQSLTLTWIAPPGPAGHVVFRVTFVQSYVNYWVGINSPVIYDGVSRDLTMMQAFSLQSATDQSCLPSRQTTTTSTTTLSPTTTTEAATTTQADGFIVTTEEQQTTTTTLPTTTTTTTTIAPTTTRRQTTTTAAPVPPKTTYFYDYYWDTTPDTQAKTLPQSTTTTTTTTTLPPTRPTTTTTQRPTTTTTTEASTTEFYFPTTTTTLAPTTTETPATTTTTLPPTTTEATTTEQTTTMLSYPTTVIYLWTTASESAETTTMPSPSTTTTAGTTTTTTQLPTTIRQFIPPVKTEPPTQTAWLPNQTPPVDSVAQHTVDKTVVESQQDIVMPNKFFLEADPVRTPGTTTTTTNGPVRLPTERYPTYIEEPRTPSDNVISQQIATRESTLVNVGGIDTNPNYVPTQTIPQTNPPVRVEQQYPTYPPTEPQRPVVVTEAYPAYQPTVKKVQSSIVEKVTERYPTYPPTERNTLSQRPVGVPSERYPAYPPTERNTIVQRPVGVPTERYPAYPPTERNTIVQRPVAVPTERYPAYPAVELNTHAQRPAIPTQRYPANPAVERSTVTQRAPQLTERYPTYPTVVRDIPTQKTTRVAEPEPRYPQTELTAHSIETQARNAELYPRYPTNDRMLIDYPNYPQYPDTYPTYIPPDGFGLYPDLQSNLSTIEKIEKRYPNEQSSTVKNSHLTFPPQTATKNNVPITTTIVPNRPSTTIPTTMIVTQPEIPTTTRQIRPPTTTSTTTSTTTTARTTPKPDMRLTPDPDCGVTQGCFDDCRNGNCNFIVSWKPNKESTTFEIRTKPLFSGPYWAAIGFSDDKLMGFDSVTECITDGTKVEAFQSYNLDYYRNLRLLTPKLGITDERGSLQNGIFYCTFTRENFVVGEKDVFDLNKDWFMMFAEGPAVNGIKIPHRYDRVPPVTSERVDLQRYPPIQENYDYLLQAMKENIRVIEVAEVPIPPEHERITLDDECGSRKSCFQDCTSTGCRFIVSWINNKDHVTFNIRAVLNANANQWIAIAFSEDEKMGEDSVVQCVADDTGHIDVKHSYNEGKNNIRVHTADFGLHNKSATLTDGIFTCSFTRDRHVPEDDRIFDLDREWKILFAHGKSKKGIMLPHTMEEKPHVSDNAVDFSKSIPNLVTATPFFIKIHASLMIFAWILCASVASVIGRYFQPYWWGEKMFGSKTWVKVHWLFVLLTCATVISGFAVIFVGVDGISQLYEHPIMSFNGTHPIMGLVVSLLALLNPLLLCLRPSEDSSSRAFFNCLYWIVEIGAHVLAVVTIYAGFGLASFLVPSFFTFLIIGYTVYQILILLFMEALKSYDAKKTIEKKKVYLYEMQIRPWNARKNNSLAAYMDLNHTSKGLKQTVLAAHLILLSALTTTMVVLIIINDDYGL